MSAFSKTSRYIPRALAQSRSYTTQAARLPTVITPSPQELSTKRLGPRNLEKAVRSIHNDGLVVVNGVASHADLDALNARMVSDARALQARGEDGPFNYNQGNLQLDAPPVAEFFSPSIFTSMYTTTPCLDAVGVLGKKVN